MIIQAELRRKQSEYEGEACNVDKVIELPAQRFKQFRDRKSTRLNSSHM